MVTIKYIVSGGYSLREVLTETENIIISTRAPEVTSEEVGNYNLYTNSIGGANLNTNNTLTLGVDTKFIALGVSAKTYIPKMDVDLVE